MKINNELLETLTRKELFVYGAEANSKNDQDLLGQITDELKKRNIEELSNE